MNKLYFIVGLPGAGKTTLAKQLASTIKNAHFIPCSKLLNEILIDEGISDWVSFDQLDKASRNRLIDLTTEALYQVKLQHGTTFADAHMLVKNRETERFEVALSTKDADIADGLIFLDSSPSNILRNIDKDNSSSVRKRPQPSEEELAEHRRLELKAAQEFCEKHKISLHIVQDKGDILDVRHLLLHFGKTGPLMPAGRDSLAQQVCEHIESIAAIIGPALVLDGDRTLSASDAFRALDTNLGLRKQNREIFEEYGHTTESLSRISENWKTVSVHQFLRQIEKVASEISIRAEWLKVLKSTSRNTPIFLITAGIPQLWQRILDHHNLPNVKVVGGTHPYLDTELITPQCKAEIVDILKGLGYWTIAAGDSPLDAPMLSVADKAIVVPDSHGGEALISQLERKDWFYLATKGYETKPKVISGNQLQQEIVMMRKFNIIQCPITRELYKKSKQQVRGALRRSHKQLGKLMMEHISGQVPELSEHNTAIISVERSGRCLTDGASEHLDAKLLFGDPEQVGIKHFDDSLENVVIFDSVIHSGATIINIADQLPKNYSGTIHICSTEVNQIALPSLSKLLERASFHCIKISSRTGRPTGSCDMGARLFGTNS